MVYTQHKRVALSSTVLCYLGFLLVTFLWTTLLDEQTDNRAWWLLIPFLPPKIAKICFFIKDRYKHNGANNYSMGRTNKIITGCFSIRPWIADVKFDLPLPILKYSQINWIPIVLNRVLDLYLIYLQKFLYKFFFLKSALRWNVFEIFKNSDWSCSDK